MKMTLGRKLGIGFGVVLLFMVVSSTVTYINLLRLRHQQDEMITLRIPSMGYSMELIAQIYYSASKVREAILMSDDPQIAARAEAGHAEAAHTIDRDLKNLQELSPRFVLQADRDRVISLLTEIATLRQRESECLVLLSSKGGPQAAARCASSKVTPQALRTVAIADELDSSFDQLNDAESKAMQSEANAAIWILITMALLAVAIGLAVAFLLSRRISSGVGMVLQRAQAISMGDLTGQPLSSSSGDELAGLATAVNHMAASLRALVGQISGGVQTLGQSASHLSSISAHTSTGVSSMAQKAHDVASAAEEASATTIGVASSMEQSTASLTSVASATEEMSATVADIAANTARARSTSEQATSKALTITDQMQKLGTAAEEIGQVTETITNISAQTNLLALNATIEAARAGAAGKGFAVVANEIKELARQTAEATEDIKARIADVQSSTSTAITDIAQITGVIKEVGGIVSSIAAAIEEQAAVTKDVAGNIAQASAGVRDANTHVAQTADVSRTIARDIAGVNADVTEIRRDGEQLQLSAAELSQLASQLQTQVAQFRM